MSLAHSLWSRCFQSAEETIRGVGLRRSKFGRSTIAALNTAGRLGVSAYLGLRTRPVMVQGQQMSCSTWEDGSFRSTLELLLDQYEPETTRVFHELLRPGMRVVDIGAHGGYFSLIAASHVGPNGTVYAFEPFPPSFNALNRNIALNGYQNIMTIQKAVTSKTERAELIVNSKGSDRHSLYTVDHEEQKEAIKVETIALDDFLRERDWPRVDLIKMDIEGAEPAALKGMAHSLRNCQIRLLVTEFSPRSLRAAGFDPYRFLCDLFEAGFSISILEGEQRPKRLSRDGFSQLVDDLPNRGGTNLLCENPQFSGGPLS